MRLLCCLLAACSVLPPSDREAEQGIAPLTTAPPVVYATSPSFTLGIGFFASGITLVPSGGVRPNLVLTNGNDVLPQPVASFDFQGGASVGGYGIFASWYSDGLLYAFEPATGDLSGTGTTDLLIPLLMGLYRDPAKGSVQVIRGGSEGPLETLVPGISAISIALADINVDGFVDLVVATAQDGTDGPGALQVYLNDGKGSFPATPAWSSAPLKDLTKVVAADINLDGWVDLAAAGTLGAIFYGKAPTTKTPVGFASTPDWAPKGSLGTGYGVDVARFGGEQAVAMSASCLELNGQPVPGCTPAFRLFRPPADTPVWTGDVPLAAKLAIADVDQDGDNDLIGGAWGKQQQPGPLVMYAGEKDSLSASPVWTSSEPTVSQGIELQRVRAPVGTATTETITTPATMAVFTVTPRRVESVSGVTVDGAPRSFLFVPGTNMVSLTPPVPKGAKVAVTYTPTICPDVLVANWTPESGSFVFLNQRTVCNQTSE